jgi:hypothetical protein
VNLFYILWRYELVDPVPQNSTHRRERTFFDDMSYDGHDYKICLLDAKCRQDKPAILADAECTDAEEDKDRERYNLSVKGAARSIIENSYSIFGTIHAYNKAKTKKQCVAMQTQFYKNKFANDYPAVFEMDKKLKEADEEISKWRRDHPAKPPRPIKEVAKDIATTFGKFLTRIEQYEGIFKSGTKHTSPSTHRKKRRVKSK